MWRRHLPRSRRRFLAVERFDTTLVFGSAVNEGIRADTESMGVCAAKMISHLVGQVVAVCIEYFEWDGVDLEEALNDIVGS
jgi:hypothetical protein